MESTLQQFVCVCVCVRARVHGSKEQFLMWGLATWAWPFLASTARDKTTAETRSVCSRHVFCSVFTQSEDLNRFKGILTAQRTFIYLLLLSGCSSSLEYCRPGWTLLQIVVKLILIMFVMFLFSTSVI